MSFLSWLRLTATNFQLVMKQSQSNADASLWPTWANKTIRKKISISAKLLKLFLFSTNLSGAEIKTFIHSLFYDEDELRWASYITVTYKMTKIVLKVLDHPHQRRRWWSHHSDHTGRRNQQNLKVPCRSFKFSQCFCYFIFLHRFGSKEKLCMSK